MIKRLFDPETEMWTDDSRNFSREVKVALKPIIDGWIERGFSVRDMDTIVSCEISLMASCELLKPKQAWKERLGDAPSIWMDISALRQGTKIDAIKAIRKFALMKGGFRCSLEQAKQWVETAQVGVFEDNKEKREVCFNCPTGDEASQLLVALADLGAKILS
jgi:ribosomal protein L7/L12